MNEAGENVLDENGVVVTEADYGDLPIGLHTPKVLPCSCDYEVSSYPTNACSLLTKQLAILEAWLILRGDLSEFVCRSVETKQEHMNQFLSTMGPTPKGSKIVKFVSLSSNCMVVANEVRTFTFNKMKNIYLWTDAYMLVRPQRIAEYKAGLKAKKRKGESLTPKYSKKSKVVSNKSPGKGKVVSNEIVTISNNEGSEGENEFEG